MSAKKNFKNQRHKKIQILIIHLNFIKNIPLKMNRHKNSKIDNSPSIYMRNPLKMNGTKKNSPFKMKRTKVLHRVPF